MISALYLGVSRGPLRARSLRPVDVAMASLRQAIDVASKARHGGPTIMSGHATHAFIVFAFQGNRLSWRLDAEFPVCQWAPVFAPSDGESRLWEVRGLSLENLRDAFDHAAELEAGTPYDLSELAAQVLQGGFGIPGGSICTTSSCRVVASTGVEDLRTWSHDVLKGTHYPEEVGRAARDNPGRFRPAEWAEVLP